MPTPCSLAQQPYELFSFARKHGLPIDAARAIIEDFGVDREGADGAAFQLYLVGRRNNPSDVGACKMWGSAARAHALYVHQPPPDETALQIAVRSCS